MAVAVAPRDLAPRVLVGDAPRSPSGPLDAPEPVRLPPARTLPRFVQSVRFGMRPMTFSLAARAELGDVWLVQLLSRFGQFAVTSHPDHVEALLKAKPADAPSLTGESPLRPVLGPNSVLTTVGERHMRRVGLLVLERLKAHAVEVPEALRVPAEHVDVGDFHRVDVLPQPRPGRAEIRDAGRDRDARPGERDDRS